MKLVLSKVKKAGYIVAHKHWNFTNSVNWIIYGLRLSKWTPDQIEQENDMSEIKGIIFVLRILSPKQMYHIISLPAKRLIWRPAGEVPYSPIVFLAYS